MPEPVIREAGIYTLSLPVSEHEHFGSFLAHLAASLEEDPQRNVLGPVIAQEDGFEADIFPWTATIAFER
jgi:hypothetical protein